MQPQCQVPSHLLLTRQQPAPSAVTSGDGEHKRVGAANETDNVCREKGEAAVEVCG